jgi:hypothetical protein
VTFLFGKSIEEAFLKAANRSLVVGESARTATNVTSPLLPVIGRTIPATPFTDGLAGSSKGELSRWTGAAGLARPWHNNHEAEGDCR